MELQSKHSDGPKMAQQPEIGKKHKLNNQKPDAKNNDLGQMAWMSCIRTQVQSAAPLKKK